MADTYIKMDFSLKTPEERSAKAQEIIDSTPPEKLTPLYLEKLADYIVDAYVEQEKEKGNKRPLMTPNHRKTISQHEVSLEGLIDKLENGEDGIYSFIRDDKNMIMRPAVKITDQDLEDIPDLRTLHDEIERFEADTKNLRGKAAYAAKQQLIAMRKDQYVIKNAYKPPIYCNGLNRNNPNKLNLDEHITITAEGDVVSDGIISLYNEQHVSMILNNYQRLKMGAGRAFDCDMKYLLEWLDSIIEHSLKKDHPLLYSIFTYKVSGKTNLEIQELIEKEYNIKHSVEYLSSLWRNKIPKVIVEYNKKDYLNWYYTFKEKGQWKKCNRCGQVKLANNFFFSKNKTSKDGFYSICKDCRNNKKDGD